MTIRAFLDSFAVSTSTAGTTQARSGYGFTPKAIIVWGFGRTDSTSATGSTDMNGSIGFAVSSSSRACQTMFDPNADTTPSPSGSGIADRIFDATGVLDVQSFDSDGITFIVDTQFSSAHRIFVLALGGPALVNAAIQQINGPASEGTKAHTGFGFKPSAALFLADPDASSGGASCSFGAAAGPNGSIVNKSIDFESDISDPSSTRASYRSAFCAFDRVSTGNDTCTVAVTNWDADGFTADWQVAASTAPSSFFTYVLALRSNPENALSLHEISTATDTVTNITISGTAASPAFGLLGSIGSGGTNATMIAGAFTALSNLSHSYYSQDNVGTSNVETAIDYEDCWHDLPGTNAQMRVFSINTNGVTFRMSVGDGGVHRTVWVLLGGAKSQVRGAPIFF